MMSRRSSNSKNNSNVKMKEMMVFDGVGGGDYNMCGTATDNNKVVVFL